MDTGVFGMFILSGRVRDITEVEMPEGVSFYPSPAIHELTQFELPTFMYKQMKEKKLNYETYYDRIHRKYKP